MSHGSASTYVLSSEWTDEENRLKALERHCAPGTIALLTSAGIRPGWRCLEVGAGAGSIARWMRDQVGPSGTVIATDIDTRFLNQWPINGIQILSHNITEDAPPGTDFDLIHGRAVLEHVPYRRPVVDRLVSWLAPGALLMVEDHDMRPAAVTAGASQASTNEVAERTANFIEACARLMSLAGAAPYFGAELPTTLAAAGLIDVTVELRIVSICSEPDNLYRLTLERIGPQLLETGLLDSDAFRHLERDFADPGTRVPGPPLVAAYGRVEP